MWGRAGRRCQPPGGGGSAPLRVFLFLLVNMRNLRGGSPEDDPSPASIINQLQANSNQTLQRRP